jgi:hypothetical protein
MPEKLNSNFSFESRILFNLNFSFGLPLAACLLIRTHQGYGHHSILDTLSKHSPAASSRVCHILVIS